MTTIKTYSPSDIRAALAELILLATNDEAATRIDESEIVMPYESTDKDGNPITRYGYIKWGVKSATDTQRSKAFNLEAAIEAYEAKIDAGKAKKPATAKTSVLDGAFAEGVFTAMDMKDGASTAQEIASILNANAPEGADPVTWQKVSAVLKAGEKAGRLVKAEVKTDDNKVKAGYIKVK